MAPLPSPSPRPFCDVCWAKPNKLAMCFQQCKKCGVGVHNECYGLPSTAAANPDFVCWACAAVGTTVRVRRRDEKTGQRLALKVTQRPTECCLCSVDDKNDWYHAMHPIYDHYGVTGRQLLLPPDRDHSEPRLAWGHTLCCFAINSYSQTSGCVYGCTADGTYDDNQGDDDDDDDDNNSDTSSANSDLQRNDSSDDDDDDDTIHHFVYCLRKSGQPDNQWTKVIRELQQLKCSICGEDDRPDSSFRIPVQCCANDFVNEFEEFSGYHKYLGNDTCYVNMHVGCSIWGRNDKGELPTCRRVYYFPGRPESVVDSTSTKMRYTQTVTNIFCEAHAQDLVGNVKGATVLRYPEHLNTKKQSSALANDDIRSDKRAPPAAAAALVRRTHHDINPDLHAHHWSKPSGGKATASTMVQHIKHHGGNLGDVRSRLGVRRQSDMDVHRFHAADLVSGLHESSRMMPPHRSAAETHHGRRKSATEVKNVGAKRKEPPSRANEPLPHKRRPDNEGKNGNEDDKPSPKENKDILYKRRRKKAAKQMYAALKEKLDPDVRSNKKRVEQIQQEVRGHWEKTLLSNGWELADFKDVWKRVWERAVNLMNLSDNATVAAAEAPMANGAKPAGRLKASSLPNDTGGDKRGKCSKTAADRDPKTSNIKDLVDTKLATIVHAIGEKESQGTDHLEEILAETKEEWKDDIVATCTPGFWDKVTERVAAKLNYSMQESDWSFIGAGKTQDKNDNIQWDTVQVLHLGLPPEYYKDV